MMAGEASEAGGVAGVAHAPIGEALLVDLDELRDGDGDEGGHHDEDEVDVKVDDCLEARLVLEGLYHYSLLLLY